MAEIPKISVTSDVKRILPERGKIVKFGRSVLLSKSSELTGQSCDGFFPQEGGQGASPLGTSSPSETFALPEIRSEDNRFCLPPPLSPERNSSKKTSMPANNVAKIFYVFSPFWLIQCRRIVLIHCPDFGQVCAPAEPKSRPIIWEKFFIEKHQKLMKMTRIYRFSWI